MQIAFADWVRGRRDGEPARTKSELARVLGTKPGQVGQWVDEDAERMSTPGAEWLPALCRVFGVSGHWLLTGDGPKPAPGRDLVDPYRQARAELETSIAMDLRLRVARAVGDALGSIGRDVDADVESIEKNARLVAAMAEALKQAG